MVASAGESWQVGFGDLAADGGLESDAPATWALTRGSSLVRIGSVAGSVLTHPDAPAFESTANAWRAASRDQGSWAISSGPVQTGAA